MIKQRLTHAVVHVNSPSAAKETRILAVVQVCYNEKDAISVAYVNMDDDKRGFEIPFCPLTVAGKLVKIPIVTGEFWTDLVNLAERALGAVKTEFGRIPSGKVFKVHKVDKVIKVEEVGEAEMVRGAK